MGAFFWACLPSENFCWGKGGGAGPVFRDDLYKLMKISKFSNDVVVKESKGRRAKFDIESLIIDCG